MLYEVLNFLKEQLEFYVSEGRKTGEPLIQLSNPWSNNDDNHKSSFLNSISLINVEEEKIFKKEDIFKRPKIIAALNPYKFYTS